jgi:hypothetical protein
MGMDMRKYLKKVFLKVDDVKANGPIRMRITDVTEGQYNKPDLTFHDGSQLSLNPTNNRVLLRAYGRDSNYWLGQEVELEVGEIQYQGQRRETILVKPISPPIENKAPPRPEFDDAIEF